MGRFHHCREETLGGEMSKYKLLQKAHDNDSYSYLARVRPMPLSANLGTRTDGQHTLSLHSQ